MRWAELLQDIRKMRLEEAYTDWQERRLSSRAPAHLHGAPSRTTGVISGRPSGEGKEESACLILAAVYGAAHR